MVNGSENPLFTAEVVTTDENGLIELDLAKHERIKETPQTILRMVKRAKSTTKLGFRVVGVSRITAFGIAGLEIFRWATTGYFESSHFGLISIMAIPSEILSNRCSVLGKRADAIFDALNPNKE